MEIACLIFFYYSIHLGMTSTGRVRAIELQ
jgi:hypothetical protein